MTDIIFDFRVGGGSTPEVLYGTVEFRPTLEHTNSTAFVLPSPTEVDLIDGKATMPDVQPSPEPDGNGEVAWAYAVKVYDSKNCLTYEYLVRVPDSATALNFSELPRMFTTKPPLYGIGPMGPQGPEGDSAYEVAVTNGFVGTESQWLASLKGDKGDTGATGATGATGPKGDKGDPGSSVTIKGSVATAADLPTTGNTTGDGWITQDNGHLHVWDGSAFQDVGLVRGPEGPAGEPGITDLVTQTTHGIMRADDKKKLDEATAGNTLGTLVQRSTTSGNFLIGEPTNLSHSATKRYVDSKVNPIELTSTDDLNDITTTHSFYQQSQSAEATLALNYPVATAGRLKVAATSANGFVYQEYTTYGPGREVYVRTKYNTTWYSWVKLIDSEDLVTSSVNGLMRSADKDKLDAATALATANTLALRDSGGRISVATPTSTGNATPKSYVDDNNHLEYRARLVGDAPNLYPEGVTSFLAASADGWNFPDGLSFHNITTTRPRGYEMGTLQIAAPYNAADGKELYFRYYVSTTSGWGVWHPFGMENVEKGFLTPEQYGAVGDGTSNDTAAVQAVIDASNTSGDPILWTETYLVTANLVNIHAVRHWGPGKIVRGSYTFTPNPTAATQENTFYCAATGISTTNDGLSPDFPTFAKTAAERLANYATPVLGGSWTIQLGTGTYDHNHRITFPDGIVSANKIKIYGAATTGHPAVPTTVFSEGYNASAVGMISRNAVAEFEFKDILFDGYNGTASAGGLTISVNPRKTYLINCHFTDCTYGFSGMDTLYDVKGGIYTRCGFLGDTANTTPPASRNGNGAGIRSLFHAHHSIGLQNANALTNGPFFRDCQTGVFAQESSTGHVDFSTFERCGTGISLAVSSRANCSGSSFTDCTVGINSSGNSYAFASGAVFSGNSQNMREILGGIVSGAEWFTDRMSAYSRQERILFSEFPNSVISATSNTIIKSLTLASGMWTYPNYSTAGTGKVTFTLKGVISGTNSYKRFILRLGTGLVTVDFTATETGNFEVVGEMQVAGVGAQLLSIKGDIHLGGTRRIGLAQTSQALTSNTALQIETYLDNSGDSVTVRSVEVKYF